MVLLNSGSLAWLANSLSPSANTAVPDAIVSGDEAGEDKDASDSDEGHGKHMLPFRKRCLFEPSELKKLSENNVAYWSSKQALVATYSWISEDMQPKSTTFQVKLGDGSRKKSARSEAALKRRKEAAVQEAVYFATHGTQMPSKGQPEPGSDRESDGAASAAGDKD